jgi:hypothetical protein
MEDRGTLVCTSEQTVLRTKVNSQSMVSCGDLDPASLKQCKYQLVMMVAYSRSPVQERHTQDWW